MGSVEQQLSGTDRSTIDCLNPGCSGDDRSHERMSVFIQREAIDPNPRFAPRLVQCGGVDKTRFRQGLPNAAQGYPKGLLSIGSDFDPNFEVSVLLDRRCC